MELEQEKIKKTNEVLTKAIEEGFPILRDYYNKKMTKLEGPKIRISLYGFIYLLAIIVIGSGLLVFYGKLEGSNFTFLLGILIGAMITFLGDLVLPVN